MLGYFLGYFLGLFAVTLPLVGVAWYWIRENTRVRLASRRHLAGLLEADREQTRFRRTGSAREAFMPAAS